MWISRASLALAVSLIAARTTRPQDAPQQIPGGAPEKKKEGRPGLIHLGPVYVTPRLRIGPIGLDTNTLWVPAHQPVDFRAGGGPGLEIVTPMGPARLTMDGGASYTYYLKNSTQRRWGGDARARLEWNRGKLDAVAEEGFRREFLRPSFEVDRRIVQDEWRTAAMVDLFPESRMRIGIDLSRRRFDVPDHQDFAGADLTQTLSRSEYKGTVVPKLRLTPKTSLLLGGDYEADRFRFETGRNADSNRLFAGFEVKSDTRLDGRIVGGVRLFRPTHPSRTAARSVVTGYADSDLWYRFGPKTRLNVRYLRDLNYSAFTVQADTPTLTLETVGAQVDKDLWRRFNFRVFGTYGHLRTAGAVTIKRDSGAEVTQVRRDVFREGGADFGYRFRGGLRLGLAGLYSNRESTFDDFGVKGLVAGVTITMGGLSYAGSWPR